MLRYKGGGFIAGVPARDLREDEVGSLGLSVDTLVASGLYEVVDGEGGTTDVVTTSGGKRAGKAVRRGYEDKAIKDSEKDDKGGL